MNRAHEIFEDAVDRPGPERAAFLDGACRSDPAARAEVESLLRAHAGARSFLGEPTRGGATLDAPLRERPGALIGRYKLLEQIGEGGFGVVFLAEQREPVTRKVALKIIKLGMDTKQVIACFEAERQALAMMDHPNIAKVLDAGETETGRPYFVMELVRGDPITAYCDRNNVTTKDRLDLFTQVCHAVQHAHQKGVIHRDIKPSNVLITVADGKPIPKVIDFGIAKATASKLTEKTLFTEHRALIGTPAYMSPEQAEMSGVDIDTRSDIYSLGVLLYELLTGTTPFDTKSLMAAGLAEIQRIIREVEPEKPSTRVATRQAELGTRPTAPGDSGPPTPPSGQPAGSAADARRVADRAALARTLRGDLDWIAMKCLEKDRTRRYETASGLAADVTRHLAGEPVLAAPPSAAYRVRKLVSRHKVGVAAGSLVAGALILGIAGTSLGLAWALRERGQARIAATRAAQSAQAEKSRAEELRQVSEFQAQMLSQIDATEAGTHLMGDIRERFARSLADTGVLEADRAARIRALEMALASVNATDTAAAMIDRTVLSPALRAIETRFKDQPLVDASLRQTLADLYLSLGRYDDAMPLQESALATRRRLLGGEHADTLYSMNRMGGLLSDRGELTEAATCLRDGLQTSRRALGEDHVETIAFINDLGLLLRKQGKLDDAEPYYREALEKYRHVLGETHEDTLTAMHNLAVLHRAQGRLEEAEAMLRDELAARRRFQGEEHPATLNAINSLGVLLGARGRPVEAEQLSREAVEQSRRVLGDEHPSTLVAIANLGELLRSQGRLVEAEPYLREALEKRRRVLGEDHPSTLGSLNYLGLLLLKQGKLDEAERCLREVLEQRRRILGEEHPSTLVSINNMGSLFRSRGKLDQAEACYREAAERRASTLGEDHPSTLESMGNLGSLLLARGKLDEAETCMRSTLERTRRVLGDDHPNTVNAVNGLAAVLQARDDHVGAAALYREALSKNRTVMAPGSAALANELSRVGSALLEWEKPEPAAEAEPLLRECLEIRRAVYPDGHGEVWRRYGAMRLLGSSLVQQAAHVSGPTEPRIAKLREAESLLLGAWAGLKDDPAVPVPGTLLSEDVKRDTLTSIVRLYEAWNGIEPGEGHQQRAEEWRKRFENGP